jgi:hypothetical protein
MKASRASIGIAFAPEHVGAARQVLRIGLRQQASECIKTHRVECLNHDRYPKSLSIRITSCASARASSCAPRLLEPKPFHSFDTTANRIAGALRARPPKTSQARSGPTIVPDPDNAT